MYIIRKPAEISRTIIQDCIKMHRADIPRLQKLYDYYLSKNEVKATPKYAEKINNNIAGYIVRTVNSYFVGNPVRYTVDEGIDIDPIVELYKRQDKSALDKSIGKDCSIFGKAYELAYMSDEINPMPKTCKLSPLNTFVVFDTSAEPRSLFAVSFLRLSRDFVITKVYTDTEIITYEGEGDILIDAEVERVLHYFGRVPVTLYQNNEEEMGDFENVLSDIDAYNRLKTNRLDDVEKFIQSVLKLIGTDLGNTDEEAEANARRIRNLQVIELPEGGDANFLTNTLDQTQIQTFANSIKEDIHMYSFVPNLSDENFASNSSGVAMKYKLLGLEQLVQDKELSFVKGLKRRLKLYRTALIAKATIKDFEIEDVQIMFNRNLPSNDLEIAQIIQLLISTGAVTKQTLISQLSFIQDPELEVANAEKNNIDNFDYKDLFNLGEVGNGDDGTGQNSN